MTNNTSNVFQSLRKVSESGHEYWSARDLARVMDYVDYRNFEKVTAKTRKRLKFSNTKLIG